MTDTEAYTGGELSDGALEQASGGVSPKAEKTTEENTCRECKAVLPKGWKKPVCENCAKKHLTFRLF